MAGILALTGGAATLLWILAVVLVIMGIVSIVRGGVLAGIVLDHRRAVGRPRWRQHLLNHPGPPAPPRGRARPFPLSGRHPRSMTARSPDLRSGVASRIPSRVEPDGSMGESLRSVSRGRISSSLRLPSGRALGTRRPTLGVVETADAPRSHREAARRPASTTSRARSDRGGQCFVFSTPEQGAGEPTRRPRVAKAHERDGYRRGRSLYSTVRDEEDDARQSRA